MLTVFTILLGVFCSAMEAMVTATIMPTIISQLGGFSLYPWVTNSFMLASVVTAPFAGALADSFGYKKCYVGGVLLFVIGSALCGFSGSMEQMIFFRVIQGAGSAAILTLSLILFGVLYPIEKRAKMQALIGAMWALASLLGPALGAFLTAKFSWQWAFWINIPVGLLIIISFLLKTKIPQMDRKTFLMDYRGGVIFSLGTLGFIYGLLNLGKFHMEPIDWAIFLSGIALLLYFLKYRTQVKDPFIPLHLLEKRTMFIPVLLAFFAGLFIFNVANFTPIFVQGVLGATAATTGKVVTTVALGSLTGSIISGTLLNRMGFRIMSTLGGIIVCNGFAVLFMQDAKSLIYMIMIGNYLVGAGVSIIANANMVSVQATSPIEHIGLSTALVSFSRTFGGMIGIALMGGLQLGVFQAGMTAIEALPMNADNIAALTESSQKIFDPIARIAILPEYLSQIVQVFANSLHFVFLGCFAIAILSVIFSVQMPNKTPKEVADEAL